MYRRNTRLKLMDHSNFQGDALFILSSSPKTKRSNESYSMNKLETDKVQNVNVWEFFFCFLLPFIRKEKKKNGVIDFSSDHHSI